jgi:ubiquitin carboxyl-terminal hydrolase 36/42
LKKKHRAKCQLSSTSTSFCVLCFFEEHVNKVFGTNDRVIVPTMIVKNIRSVCSRFRLGRQEDSHELLILLLDKMQSNLFGNPKKLEKSLADKSVLAQIFMGTLKSTVECLSCKGTSDRLETCFDLCLVKESHILELIICRDPRTSTLIRSTNA